VEERKYVPKASGNIPSDDDVSRKIKQRSTENSRDFFVQIFIALNAVLIAGIAIVAPLAQILHNLFLIISLVIVVTLVAVAGIAIFRLELRHKEKPYTYFGQIQDENLKRLITVISRSQSEFDHMIAVLAKNELPRA
jgi:uncharacterized membrane protein